MRLKRLAIIAAPLAILVLAVAAHAAEVEGADPIKQELTSAPATAIVTILIFVCLFIVLRFTAWKPILQGLQARETAIREGVEAAANARAEADRTMKELESKMAQAQKQGQLALTQAKADAQKLAENIRTTAEAEANALKERGIRDIESAKQQALAEINAHAAELATAIAQKILKRSVTVDDQSRLVEESLAEFAAKN